MIRPNLKSFRKGVGESRRIQSHNAPRVLGCSGHCNQVSGREDHYHDDDDDDGDDDDDDGDHYHCVGDDAGAKDCLLGGEH